jgi:ubiquinone/menaquinone biosynthesis C-methylase UbiE
MDYDQTSMPENYDRGRDHGPAVLQQWINAVANHVGANGIRTILDVGCGTGRFSRGLARHFNARVIGIDPSIKMLSEAISKAESHGTAYAVGAAEAQPLPDNSIDLIFISMAFHHFTDREMSAMECHRVLRKHGRLCLRTGGSERISEYPYVPFFPQTRSLLEQHLPSVSAQREVFERARFQTISEEIITQQIAADYDAYAEKIAVKADSILIRLSDSDFDAGMKALRSYARTPEGHRPVTEPIDLLVFRKR